MANGILPCVEVIKRAGSERVRGEGGGKRAGVELPAALSPSDRSFRYRLVETFKLRSKFHFEASFKTVCLWKKPQMDGVLYYFRLFFTHFLQCCHKESGFVHILIGITFVTCQGLQQFESLMALTNLAQMSDEVRWDATLMRCAISTSWLNIFILTFTKTFSVISMLVTHFVEPWKQD